MYVRQCAYVLRTQGNYSEVANILSRFVVDLQGRTTKIEEEATVTWKRLKRSLQQPRVALLTCLTANLFK